MLYGNHHTLIYIYTYDAVSAAMSNISSYIKRLFCVIGHFLLSLIIPKRRKRMFLLATLYHELAKRGLFSTDNINKLNKTMRLTDDETSLILPDPIYEMVWDEADINRIVEDIPMNTVDGDTCLLYNDAYRVSEEILSVTPSWLWYASLDVMKNDIINLFYCRPNSIA